MQQKQKTRRISKSGPFGGLLRGGALALVASAALGAPMAAQAFVYTSGDVVGIFVDGSSELIVNLGPAASLTNGAVFDFPTPAGFGADGAIGGKFVAYTAEAPYSGSLGRNVTYTAGGSVSPTSFDTNVSGFVARIGLAQQTLEDGGAADKFLEVLNNFPAPPQGGILENTADRLSLLTSNLSSYTATIGLNGTSDRIGNQLPFETDVAITGTNPALLWKTQRITNVQALSTPLWVLTVQGNVGGGSPTARITVPEPAATATSFLLGFALIALGALARGSRRRDVC